jgi:hypothetical protein
MAKYECNLIGNIDELSETIDKGIMEGSLSASYENGSYYTNGGVTCVVRVYERYSMIGENRVSLSVTLVGNEDDDIFVSAITSGGSQAVLFKINTFGEEAFLDKLVEIVERFR